MFKKRVGITQKIMKHPHYNEVLDCLDTRWIDLLVDLNFQPIPLPNIDPRYVDAQLSSLALNGIILSGGNTISSIETPDDNSNGLSFKRDEYEHRLLEYATKTDIPLFGVCRGMQMINLFYGGNVKRISGHAGNGDHRIIPIDADSSDELPKTVNSYHNFGIPHKELARPLQALACDEDGCVEVFRHKAHRVSAIMWHPERETPFKQKDINLLKKMFDK